MAKGSQLTQLKAALADAGLNRRPQKNKKRTPSSRVAEHDKAKKAARLRELQQKLNPFDVKVTKLKHDVGGRKIKGVMGRPAQSKQAGMQQVLCSVQRLPGLSCVYRVVARKNTLEGDRDERTRRRCGRSTIWRERSNDVPRRTYARAIHEGTATDIEGCCRLQSGRRGRIDTLWTKFIELG